MEQVTFKELEEQIWKLKGLVKLYCEEYWKNRNMKLYSEMKELGVFEYEQLFKDL